MILFRNILSRTTQQARTGTFYSSCVRGVATRHGTRSFSRESVGGQSADYDKVSHVHGETYKQSMKAYRLFDIDGDGDISPEELIQILTSIGESPGDLNLYFAGMATGTTTDYQPVVQFLTYLIHHGNTVKSILCFKIS